MSESPSTRAPCAAYAEDVQEDTETTIPGTKKSAQVRTKRTKRDEASDSGYSSRTAATNGTQSTSNSSRLLNFVGKMTGSSKKSSKAPAEASPVKSASKKATKPKEGLRLNTNVESREDAARIQLSGEPIRRTASNRSHEQSPQLTRSVKPSPPLVQPHSSIRTAPPLRMGMSRPVSYHAGASSSYSAPYHSVSFSPSTSIPMYPQPQPPPTHYQPLTYISSASPTMSLPRQTAYPFEPTLPPQYMPASAGWEPMYQSPFMQSQPSHPPLPRRYSMAGPSPQAIVEYPMVPTRALPRPPVSFHNPGHYVPAITDEGIHLEDNEAYYRREEARQKMPPPQRPVMRHASTASAALRRSNRNSLEEVPRASTSSRAESFGSYKEERIPLMSRGSSSKNVPLRVAEAPPSPSHSRRSRPQSFHAGVDSELAAERYQAKQRGSTEPHSINAFDVEKVTKSSKGHKSKASDSGSRSSEGKRDSTTKKRLETRQKQSEVVSVDVEEGCTANVRRSSKGYVVRVSLTEDSKNRSGRPSEREDPRGDRRFSASSRRESISEAIARTIIPRRPSSSRPTGRRQILEDSNEELTKRLKDVYRTIDDTAVEDDEQSEPEPRKRRNEKHEKLTTQRLQRLKPDSVSRQSSRSARSAKSTKSERSVPSSKKSALAEGQPF